MATSPDGSTVHVAGTSAGAVFVAAHDFLTGAVRWAARYAGLKRDPDQARQVAASADGSSVFVIGNSDSVCRGSDVATLADQA